MAFSPPASTHPVHTATNHESTVTTGTGRRAASPETASAASPHQPATGMTWVFWPCPCLERKQNMCSHLPPGAAVQKTDVCYLVTMVKVERVQTGLRIERKTLKVLKGLAEYLDLSLGDLVEGMVLHAFEGKPPFGPSVLAKIDQLKAVYGLELTAADAHKLEEQP